MYRVIFFVIFCLTTIALKANDIKFKFISEQIQFVEKVQEGLVNDSITLLVQKKVKFRRGKAILFTVFTGFLGGHRIYFGSHHRTPIIYSLTFGGLGLLPLIDLIHIIFTKDLSKYQDKSHIIMWGKWIYSTVTDLAKFLGWSTLQPLITAMWYESNCNGIEVNKGLKASSVAGISIT